MNNGNQGLSVNQTVIFFHSHSVTKITMYLLLNNKYMVILVTEWEWKKSLYEMSVKYFDLRHIQYIQWYNSALTTSYHTN